jgi:hypothetical protein
MKSIPVNMLPDIFTAPAYIKIPMKNSIIDSVSEMANSIKIFLSFP